MPDFPSIALRLSPGAGLVTRRSRAVLFLPSTEADCEAIVRSFDAAVDGQELAALAETVVAGNLRVPAFAAVSFSEEITVRVFGDLAVASDAPSLPHLSGQGAATWVDHTLCGHAGTVSITAGEPHDGSLTDLGHGTVHAGGFALIIGEPRTPPVSAPAAEPVFTPPAMGTEEPSTGCDATEALEVLVLPEGVPDAPDHGDRWVLPVELRFEDGTRVAVDHELLIGRNPVAAAAERGAVPWVVDDERISRAHLSVMVSHGAVTIEDCGSRNGTLHHAPGGSAPVPLVPGRPASIEPGSVVYLGSTTFTVGGRS